MKLKTVPAMIPVNPLRSGSFERFFTSRQVKAGAGQTRCWECEGSGKWELPDGDMMQCVDCKGTGLMWVSL